MIVVKGIAKLFKRCNETYIFLCILVVGIVLKIFTIIEDNEILTDEFEKVICPPLVR